MYKRLRKEYNAFSLKGAAIFTFPRPWLLLSTAVTNSYHGRGKISSRPWRTTNTGKLQGKRIINHVK